MLEAVGVHKIKLKVTSLLSFNIIVMKLLDYVQLLKVSLGFHNFICIKLHLLIVLFY